MSSAIDDPIAYILTAFSRSLDDGDQPSRAARWFLMGRLLKARLVLVKDAGRMRVFDCEGSRGRMLIVVTQQGNKYRITQSRFPPPRR
jgi:hypothetical protein